MPALRWSGVGRMLRVIGVFGLFACAGFSVPEKHSAQAAEPPETMVSSSQPTPARSDAVNMPLADASSSLSWGDVLNLPTSPVGRVLKYGPAAQQFGELRLPSAKTEKPPVVVLLHGGCWLAQFDLEYFRHWADYFHQLGYATWNLEYRRIGDAGAGWPGTFQDVAAGIDHLRELAQEYSLDLSHILLAGHSAGGQLALWAAQRERIQPDSPLYRKNMLPVQAVLGLAPITDLATYRIGTPGSCNAAVDELLGGNDRQHPTRYQQTSPLQALPLEKPLVFLQGDDDSIVPLAGVQSYVGQAKKAGDRAELLLLPGAGHFDVAVPTRQNTVGLAQVLERLLKAEY